MEPGEDIVRWWEIIRDGDLLPGSHRTELVAKINEVFIRPDADVAAMRARVGELERYKDVVDAITDAFNEADIKGRDWPLEGRIDQVLGECAALRRERNGLGDALQQAEAEAADLSARLTAAEGRATVLESRLVAQTALKESWSAQATAAETARDEARADARAKRDAWQLAERHNLQLREGRDAARRLLAQSAEALRRAQSWFLHVEKHAPPSLIVGGDGVTPLCHLMARWGELTGKALDALAAHGTGRGESED